MVLDFNLEIFWLIQIQLCGATEILFLLHIPWHGIMGPFFQFTTRNYGPNYFFRNSTSLLLNPLRYPFNVLDLQTLAFTLHIFLDINVVRKEGIIVKRGILEAKKKTCVFLEHGLKSNIFQMIFVSVDCTSQRRIESRGGAFSVRGRS